MGQKFDTGKKTGMYGRQGGRRTSISSTSTQRIVEKTGINLFVPRAEIDREIIAPLTALTATVDQVVQDVAAVNAAVANLTARIIALEIAVFGSASAWTVIGDFLTPTGSTPPAGDLWQESGDFIVPAASGTSTVWEINGDFLIPS